MDKSKAKKNANKAMYIKKPFLRGKPWDSLCLKTTFGLFGGYVLLMIAFVLLGSLMMIDQTTIRIIINALLLVGSYLIFFSFGTMNGTQAVNQGEILQNRLDSGRPVTKKEQDCCYHPVKGLLIALTALLPFLILSIIFACITTQQMTSIGGLPSWVSALSNRSEVMDPIIYYTTPVQLNAQDILRIVIRMCMMPWVNIFDSSNMANMLMLERIAPALMLIPALCYGLGYTQGPRSRARVHGDIALGRKKAAKKARRDHKRKVAARQPEQLN